MAHLKCMLPLVAIIVLLAGAAAPTTAQLFWPDGNQQYQIRTAMNYFSGFWKNVRPCFAYLVRPREVLERATESHVVLSPSAAPRFLQSLPFFRAQRPPCALIFLFFYSKSCCGADECANFAVLSSACAEWGVFLPKDTNPRGKKICGPLF